MIRVVLIDKEEMEFKQANDFKVSDGGDLLVLEKDAAGGYRKRAAFSQGTWNLVELY